MRFVLIFLFLSSWSFADKCDTRIAGKGDWAKLEVDESGIPVDTEKGQGAIDREVAILIGHDLIEGHLIDAPFRDSNRIFGEFEVLTSDGKTLFLKNRKAIREIRVRPRKPTSSKGLFDGKYASWRSVAVEAGEMTDAWERKFLIGKVISVYVKSELVEEEMEGKLVALEPFEIVTAAGKTRLVRDLTSIQEIRTRTPRLR